MSIYTPTRLYIKRHTLTGLMYFGKTIRDDFEDYDGSGIRWTNHIDFHGREHVETVWVSDVFHEKDDIVDFALFFSDLHDIVASSKWANLIPEDGLHGWPPGVPKSDEHKRKIGEANRKPKPPRTPEHVAIAKATNAKRIGSKHSEETKAKMRKPKPPRTAEHAEKIAAAQRGKKKNFNKTEEQRMRLANQMKGAVRVPYVRTPEQNAANSTRLKAIWEQRKINNQ